jgi:hypothetical protein
MAKNFEKLIFGGLHGKHGIWVPSQPLLWDQGKPRKTSVLFLPCYIASARTAQETSFPTVLQICLLFAVLARVYRDVAYQWLPLFQLSAVMSGHLA